MYFGFQRSANDASRFRLLNLGEGKRGVAKLLFVLILFVLSLTWTFSLIFTCFTIYLLFCVSTCYFYVFNDLFLFLFILDFGNLFIPWKWFFGVFEFEYCYYFFFLLICVFSCGFFVCVLCFINFFFLLLYFFFCWERLPDMGLKYLEYFFV